MELVNNDYKDRYIDELCEMSFESMNTRKIWDEMKRLYDGDVKEDLSLFKPLYPTFVNYDEVHDKVKDPIYLNDYDLSVSEDVEEINRLTKLTFNENTFETIASCYCGHNKGNWLLGTDKICEICNTKVERHLDGKIENKVWLHTPEGVDVFINPGFYTTFFRKLTIGKVNFEVIAYMISSSYRKSLNKKDNNYYVLKAEVESLGIPLNINDVYKNIDKIVDYFLLGPGKTKILIKKYKLNEYYEFWTKYKKYAFSTYLPVPNKITSVIQIENKRYTADKNQLVLNQIYLSMADIPKSSKYVKLNEKALERNRELLSKYILELGIRYSATIKERAYVKNAIFRKHIFSGSVPMTARCVITSITSISDPYRLHIPWKVALSCLEFHILNFLYKKGYNPLDAQEIMANATNKNCPIISEFFDFLENPMHGQVICGRNPTLEYLNSKLYFVTVKRDITDDSIGLNIQQVKEKNADYDGDSLYLYFILDLESKIRSYGSLPHHQMLDSNKFGKVHKYFGQTKTLLLNLNSTMSKVKSTNGG